jgi:potassium efflux system protein
MEKLDNAHLILNSINISKDGEFSTQRIERDLPSVNQTLQAISNNIHLASAIPEFKTLQIYGVLLDDIENSLSDWRSTLFKYHDDLAGIDSELLSLTRDPAILKLPSDSLYQQIYLDELRQLAQKWRQADRSTEEHLNQIKALQLTVSKQYFMAVDLKSELSYMKKQLAHQLFSKQYRYFWEGKETRDTAAAKKDNAVESPWIQMSLIGFFLEHNLAEYILLFALFSLFYWWMRHRNYAWAYSLILLVIIHPLVELHASALPLNQLPLLVAITFLFWRQGPRNRFRYWLIIASLYILLLVNRAILDAFYARTCLLILSLVAFTWGSYAMWRLAGFFSLNKLIKLSFWVFAALNLVAIAANLFSRFSLARICITSAMFGVVEAIGLAVFMTCIQDRLRPSGDKTKEQLTKWDAIAMGMQKGSFQLLRVYSLVLWLITLAINLNVYDYLRTQLEEFIGHSFRIGSFSFRFGSILLFFGILYLSNLLQKYVGIIYDATADHGTSENGRKGSWMAMIRLFLIIGGFLLAIAASGVPLDKITIILGALGVGIGLGLQNIVNNLVSGIILVFERPFQIGDFIEISRKKGVVRDIGIRSSKMVTEDGADIIIPNGDLLSGQVVNWTVHARRVQVQISLTIESGPSLEDIESIVRKTLADKPGLSKEKQPRVLLNTSTERSTNITILVWVSNIGHIQSIKSQILRLLYQGFKDKGVRVL